MTGSCGEAQGEGGGDWEEARGFSRELGGVERRGDIRTMWGSERVKTDAICSALRSSRGAGGKERQGYTAPGQKNKQND